jgi:hypothetical protein
MRAVYALVAVLALVILGWVGTRQPWLFAVVLPTAAVAIFVAGVIFRVWVWGRAPVPFRITSVGGQQASLPWIKHSRLDSPRNGREAALRVAFDVLLFRSLFRNTRVRRGAGHRPIHDPDRLLWAAALAFHWALLIVLVRHLRFFLEPPPALLATVEHWDGFFQLTSPTLFASDVLLIGALVIPRGPTPPRSAAPLHLAAGRLLPAVPAPRGRGQRHLHALSREGRPPGGQAARARASRRCSRACRTGSARRSSSTCCWSASCSRTSRSAS